MEGQSAIGFVAALVRHRPAIVHVKTARGRNFYQNALRVGLARVCGRRTILQIHDGAFPRFYDATSGVRRTIIRAVFRLSHEVVGLSPSWARYFHDVTGARRVCVVPNGLQIDPYVRATPDRSGFGIAPERLAVLFMGTGVVSFDVDKGLDDLIAAVATARVQNPQILLVIAGGAPHADRLTGALGPEGDGWRSVGRIGPDRKAALYRSVDIFVLPSRFENMPNTVLEAMAAGIAVVATPVGAVPEMLRDQHDGLLVDVGDVAGLTERLLALSDSAPLRARLGAEARRTVTREFDFASVEAKHAALYRRVAPHTRGLDDLPMAIGRTAR